MLYSVDMTRTRMVPGYGKARDRLAGRPDPYAASRAYAARIAEQTEQVRSSVEYQTAYAAMVAAMHAEFGPERSLDGIRATVRRIYQEHLGSLVVNGKPVAGLLANLIDMDDLVSLAKRMTAPRQVAP